MKGGVKIGCFGATALLLALILVVFVQGRRAPTGRAEYVAMGSSFAAGAGLGALQPGSPILCARSSGGYPEQLAHMLNLSIIDMACGGAVTRHLLSGGQYFQGPQLRAVQRDTRLVTITVGGNDTLYIADLSQLAARNSGSAWGWLVRRFWRGPKSPQQRNFAQLQADLVATVTETRKRAPRSVVVLATYPTILPPSGTCARLGLTVSETDGMRDVAERLAATTRDAAEKTGVIVVDMHRLGVRHHACSDVPWTNGWTNGGIAPFHPNAAGAAATAKAIADALRQSPAGITAIRQNDAAGHQARRVGREK